MVADRVRRARLSVRMHARGCEHARAAVRFDQVPALMSNTKSCTPRDTVQPAKCDVCRISLREGVIEAKIMRAMADADKLTTFV